MERKTSVAVVEGHGGDGNTIGAMIGRAFADDPVNQWVFGRGSMIPTFAVLARYIYIPTGFCHIARDPQGQPLGATMWMLGKPREQPGMWLELRVGGTMLVSAGLGAMQRGFALSKAFDAAKPKQPYAYLFTVGVVPEAQGQGIGGQLLRAGLEHVDAAGLPCYLESTKQSNNALYRHFGFEELPALAMPEGCPPVWPMLRPAQR